MPGPPNPPRFKVGDEVISFRHERAKVIDTQTSKWEGKSHRVRVEWAETNEDGFTQDAFRKNEDKVFYYEEVFEPWKGTIDEA